MSFINWEKLGVLAGTAAVVFTHTTRNANSSAIATSVVVAFGAYSFLKGIVCGGSSPVAPLPESSPEPEKYEALRDAVVSILGRDSCDTTTYEGSSLAISKFLKTGLLKAEDFRRGHADKVFHIHKQYGPLLQGGVAVKVCVTLNLFCGSVANLGSDDQRGPLLQGILDRGELGSFAMTEIGAGVTSGLIIDTLATWTPEGYELHSPTHESTKMWISQGLTARWSVVIARLILPTGKKDYGPHAFLIDTHQCRDRGLTITDMPPKTAFNNLDNAYMKFDRCRVPLNALLSGLSNVAPDGTYQLSNPNKPFRFEIVMQQILAGRLCIALAGTKLLQATEQNIRHYNRLIPSGKNQTLPINQLPLLRTLLDRCSRIQRVLWQYAEHVVDRFSQAPDLTPEIVDSIACAKVLNIGFAIDMTMKLKGQIGSYSLQQQSPFGDKTDLLYVFQFAEGDSGILKQKLARDLVTKVASSPTSLLRHAVAAVFTRGIRQQLSQALLKLVWRMAGAKGDEKVRRWLDAHELVEAIAVAHCVLSVRRTSKKLKVSKADLNEFDRWFRVFN